MLVWSILIICLVAVLMISVFFLCFRAIISRRELNPLPLWTSPDYHWINYPCLYVIGECLKTVLLCPPLITLIAIPLQIPRRTSFNCVAPDEWLTPNSHRLVYFVHRVLRPSEPLVNSGSVYLDASIKLLACLNSVINAIVHIVRGSIIRNQIGRILHFISESSQWFSKSVCLMLGLCAVGRVIVFIYLTQFIYLLRCFLICQSWI